jgi:superkiller protein 3
LVRIRLKSYGDEIIIDRVQKAFNVVLATSLVHFYPPKHHPRALGVIERVLVLDPNNTSCLMGRGYVLQYMDKWVEAGTLFAKVAQLIPEDLEIGLRAKEEHAWCQFHTHNIENGVAGLKDVLNILDSIDDRNLDNARCLWRLGKCYWEMGGECNSLTDCGIARKRCRQSTR